MRILVACECSGVVRDAFRDRGHDAISCDLSPSDTAGPHIVGDVLPLLREPWDMVLAFPPCTYLSASGLHHNKRNPERAEKTKAGLEFFAACLEANAPRVVVENPVGAASRIRKPFQIIQPHDFGADASKRTCLWLGGLMPLRATFRLPGRMVEWPRGSGRYVERWGNQTDSGQNREPPGPDRAKRRSRTFPGIAAAMAEQWG